MNDGKGKDEDAKDEEELEEEEPLKKKGKVIITKPSKPSTIMFTRRLRKKSDKGGVDIIFIKPPPTFQDKLKELEDGTSIEKFKALKYETRTNEE